MNTCSLPGRSTIILINQPKNFFGNYPKERFQCPNFYHIELNNDFYIYPGNKNNDSFHFLIKLTIINYIHYYNI